MSYPDASSILMRAQVLDVDPLLCYAYAAFRGRIPTNRSELEEFVRQTNTWLNQSGIGAEDTNQHLLWGYVQAHGGFPATLRDGLAYLVTQGWWMGGLTLETGRATGLMQAPGQGYPPPGGGPITPTCPPGFVWSATAQACVQTGTTPPTGMLETIMNYIRAHPVQTGVIAMGAYIVFMMPRRR